MAVSRMIAYEWRCTGCDRSQEAPVWSVLDAGERPDAVAPLTPGLAFVACPACGTQASIDAPMLLIRPADALPKLVAVGASELAGQSPTSGEQLAREALAARARTDDVIGPMIPLPRLLLPLVLTRDVAADSADRDRAIRDTGIPEPLAGWYRWFLQLVRKSELQRRASLALRQLLTVPPADLPGFLDAHPELGSTAALGVVSELASEATGANAEVVQTYVQLVEGLAARKPAPQVAAEYLAAAERSGRMLHEELNELIVQAREHPGPEGIAHARAALDMAVRLGHSDLEAQLSADLAERLLAVLVPDSKAIEEAIGLLRRALTLIPDDDLQWPAWAGNLGLAYHRRIIGDPAENWETARDLLERACGASDRDSDPRRWAICQTNYGFLLSERPDGSTPEDLDLAIEHLRAGLRERSPQVNRVDWAYSQLNLGLLYRRRAVGSDLGDAAECYRQALAHLHPADDTQLWAALQNNLADVLLTGDPADTAGAAMAARSGLEVTDPRSDPLTRARLLWTLGRTEDTIHGKLSTTAVAPRQEALQLLAPGQAPELYRRIGGELADAYSQLGDWHAAADIYTGMLTAFAALYDAQASAEGRRRVLASSPTLGRWAAYALARAGRPQQAVETIENGRARQLSSAVGRDTADLARLAAADPHLADRYREALAGFRAALAGAGQNQAQADAQRRVTAAEHAIQGILEQIRAIPGFERFLRPMSVSDIRQAGHGYPVIYLISAPAGSYVLTVMPERTGPPVVDAVAVPEVTSVDVLRLEMFDYLGDSRPGLLSAQSAGWRRFNRLLPAALERLTEMQPLAEPVAGILARSPGNCAVVIPTGFLGLIPLHATPLPDRSGRVLDDIGEIYFAPSAAVFAACAKRASTPRQEHLVGVADPPHDSLNPLPYSRAELSAIQAMFETRASASCKYGSDATRSWLLQHIEQASCLHLACHGGSRPGTTADGRLLLAGDTTLTIDDLIDGRLEGCRLTVASACQSGHYSTSGDVDEFTGLPAGFLQAGAACAIVSLWQVNDRATAMLMIRFYELLLDPATSGGTTLGPVAAFRQARTWLRQLTTDEMETYIQAHPPLAADFGNIAATAHSSGTTGPESLPYAAPQYWAAFTAWGT